ncbi:Protein of unknown function DUF2148 [Bacteroides coprosuis DSM 18011]|uniref:DUF2148 domain-containing protein n=1 Tax=Bacteroides coprosuis DSM 18011 TaxID=679937 RepID=F3ZQH9_9BACE|nr:MULTISPECIES: DUF2148 domain-containing protein [Bacteroides]EGJ71774.1 Protein of unknown function DUF2148 [Bacteroides coprosuis DSM 18011]
MILNERDNRKERALDVAYKMINAARTAPKTKGADLIETAIVTGENIQELSEEMLYLEYRGGKYQFDRDSANILQAECVVLIGTKEKAMGLNCGHCGFITCGSRSSEVLCVFNSVDVGIAVGSACAMAADMRVDTRVMFSAGLAAQKLNYLPGCSMLMAIPISISSKNPFFDRQPKK